MSAEPHLHLEIVAFWRVAGPKRWFKRDPTFDDDIRERFELLHHAAARGEFDHWAQTAEGALALVLLLDQVPRNLYRGSAHAYATDGLARRIAAEAVNGGLDHAVEPALRVFFYMPSSIRRRRRTRRARCNCSRRTAMRTMPVSPACTLRS